MRFKVPIMAVVEAPSQAQAVADAHKTQKLLDNPMVKMLLRGEGVQLIEAKVDPTRVTPA
jgi:hypothetical protein